MQSVMQTARGAEKPGQFDLLATCTFGLEAVVARELGALGYPAKGVGTGRVLFRGDERAIARANLWLRAADRVLVRVAAFPAPDFDALFEGVKALPWERWVARDAAFPVAGRAVRSKLSSEPAVQRATKRAIVDRLKAAYGRGVVGAEVRLPETGAKVQVEVSILRDEATLTIDTSGAGLHKRGYREGTPGEAALRETLAAGLVELSVWRPGRALVDPFCGSGTIAIEAALLARNIAPGLNRGFDAELWSGPNAGKLIAPAVWREAREEARAAIVPERVQPPVHATDLDEGALRLARLNAKAAGVEKDIHFARRDFAELASKLEYGVVVTNPPYGVRLGEEKEIERLYRSMPVVFRKLPTWSFHILTGRLDMERLFGQEATRRRKFYNAKIETTYFSFLGPRPPSMGEGEFQREEREGDGGGREEDFSQERGVEETEAATEESEGGTGTVGGGEEGAPSDSLSASSPRPSQASRSSRSNSSPAIHPTFGGLRERDTREAGEFARCLANNLRHLRKYPGRGITCYRVYERDVPDVPLIVDRYEDRYHVVEYEREHSRTGAQQADWFDLMRRTVAEAGGVPVEHVYVKEKHRQRGLTQHEKVAEARNTFVVQEGGLRFEVNLSDYVDTGLFLDHRLTRQMFREQSAGKRVLNLFGYTGSFTVYAAAGGARSTTTVDLSKTYLAWAQRNLNLNGFTAPGHSMVRGDVLEFLRDHKRPAGGSYDLAIVDPPTFSNSKSTERDWEVATLHADLLRLLGPLMSPGGVVYFSTNYRRFRLDEAAVAESGFVARDISARTVPPEYRNRKIHLCWRMVRGKE